MFRARIIADGDVVLEAVGKTPKDSMLRLLRDAIDSLVPDADFIRTCANMFTTIEDVDQDDNFCEHGGDMGSTYRIDVDKVPDTLLGSQS